MVKRISRRRGYTLIEMMLVVVILGILASVGAKMLLQVNRYFIMAKTKADIQREARAAMYVITRELRQAKSSTIVVDNASSQPFYSRISFTKFDGKKNPTLTFWQNGNQLIQTINGGQIVLSNHLQYMAFAFPRSDDMTILSVAMTLQENIYQGRSKALHMASEQVQVMNQ